MSTGYLLVERLVKWICLVEWGCVPCDAGAAAAPVREAGKSGRGVA